MVDKYDDNGYEDFALAYEGKLHENYFTHPSMTAFNGYDVRGYRFSNWSPDIITTKFTDDTKSKVVEYNGISYIPKTGMKITVEMAEGMTGDHILTLMLNGRTITASDGTETDPYVIASTPEWDFVPAKVKDGNTYRNKYLRLDADITVSQMVGTSENPVASSDSYTTLAVPFDISSEQLTNLGIKAMWLDSSSAANGVLTLNFTDVSKIEAGKPYLVKVEAAVENPTFEGVTVSRTTTETETLAVDFIPALGATTLKGDLKSFLFVGEGNKLCHPSAENQQMKGFRAYFKLANWLVDNNVGDVNGDGNVSVNDIMAVVHIVFNGGSGVNNIVVNGADGITFDGNATTPVAAGENHLWNE